ncbi:MAG: carboxypeptidase regulatory-like domain-containing protein [Gemmatimonadota bacterium]
MTAFVLPALAQGKPQSGGVVLRGMVVDTAGTPVRGAEVTVLKPSMTATTGQGGRFILAGIPGGVSTIRVRYIDYRPLYFDLTARDGDTVNVVITVEKAPVALPEVVVYGKDDSTEVGRIPTSRLQGFFERRARGLGDYLGPEDIARINPLRVADLFRNIPGFKTSATGGVIPPVRCSGTAVWINGAQVRGGLNNALSMVLPNDIQAMEVYKGAGETPPEYAQFGNCAVVIWTR